MVNTSIVIFYRYRYGIKLILISGVMGNFNMNNPMNHITSGIVLWDYGTILSSLIIFSRTRYGKYYKKIRYTQKSISNPSKNTLVDLHGNNNLRNRKNKSYSSISKWHDEVYLDSESSFDYSQDLDNSQNLDRHQKSNENINEVNCDNNLPINYQFETSI